MKQARTRIAPKSGVQGANRRPVGDSRVMRITAGIALALACFMHSTSILAADKIVMASVVSKDKIPLAKALYRIYIEAFRRLDLTMDYVEYPVFRASAMADQGLIDGEIGRSEEYGYGHPNLIRVNESPIDITVTAFAIDPNIKVSSWESFRGANYRIDYRLGYKLLPERLSKLVPVSSLSVVEGPENGLLKLIARRTDIYVDIEEVVAPMLEVPPFADKGIRVAGELEKLHIYAYLNKKHQDLALKLGATLRDMKAEGLIQKYQAEAFGR